MKAIVKVENVEVSKANQFGAELIARFCKFAGVSASSQITYAKQLKIMFGYFAENDITNPTRESIVDWVEDMKAAGLAASTVQLRLTACKIFFRWLQQENLYRNIADHLKSGVKISHTHKRDSLTVEQCRSLVDDVKGDSVKALRDKAILSLMVTAGLRTIEICRADVDDIRHERGKWFLSVQGKGRSSKDERVLLSKQTYKAIQIYLKARGKIQPSAPLFASTSNRNKDARLDTQTIRRLCKNHLRGIGLDSKRLSAHSLRHSVATILVETGVELPKVQRVLRHRDLSTTMIYAHAWERSRNDSEQILANLLWKED